MAAFNLRFHHAAISVPDLDASIAWFEGALDFVVEKVAVIDAIPARVAMLRRDHLRIEIFEIPGANELPEGRRDPLEDVRTHGNKHVAFAVSDLDEVVDELRRRGVEIVFESRTELSCCAYIRDNCGNLMEFIQQVDLFDTAVR